MNPSLYKEVAVQRGFTYRYYHSPPAEGKPTLLFVHGFPSTAYDWHRQVAYLQPLGYGILAPDLLGAGGTAKPLDYKAFRMNAMAHDVMDILAAEGVQKVVGISHDWFAFVRIYLHDEHTVAHILSLQGIPAVVAPSGIVPGVVPGVCMDRGSVQRARDVPFRTRGADGVLEGEARIRILFVLGVLLERRCA